LENQERLHLVVGLQTFQHCAAGILRYELTSSDACLKAPSSNPVTGPTATCAESGWESS
jgi:hypothetical protein